MAKKENKYIGYLVISVIPIIGIIWAGVAGIRHNVYVKQAVEEEKKFEVEFKNKLNTLENVTITDDLNITSAKLISYSTKLLNDTYNKNASYTLELCANPKTHKVEDKVVIDSFDLTFEFFISQEQYTTISEHYSNDAISEVGYLDSLYQTYYANNPRKSPIYVIKDIFNSNYEHINYFEYKSDVFVGTTPDSIIDLIDSLGEIKYENKEQFNELGNKITLIETSYSCIKDDKKELVTNYEKLLDAKVKYQAKKVEGEIIELGSLDDINISTYSSSDTKITNAKRSYNSLTEEQKGFVENYDHLIACENKVLVVKVEYYINRAEEEKANNDQQKFERFVNNAANFYNNLSEELAHQVEEEFLNKLISYVEEFNSKYPNRKITLKYL